MTNRRRAVRELQGALELLQRSARQCPQLLHIAKTGIGGLHIANAHVRDDGVDYRFEADWIDDLVRGAFYALKALEEEGALLGKWASVAKGLGLDQRNAEIVDYDDELAGIVQDVAAATLKWREDQWLEGQDAPGRAGATDV